MLLGQAEKEGKRLELNVHQMWGNHIRGSHGRFTAISQSERDTFIFIFLIFCLKYIFLIQLLMEPKGAC